MHFLVTQDKISLQNHNQYQYQYSYLHVVQQLVLCLYCQFCEQQEVDFLHRIHFLEVGMTEQLLTGRQPRTMTSELDHKRRF